MIGRRGFGLQLNELWEELYEPSTTLSSPRPIRDALAEYIAALEETYPAAKGEARVVTRQDNRVVVSVPRKCLYEVTTLVTP
jgi:hypothetical protein